MVTSWTNVADNATSWTELSKPSVIGWTDVAKPKGTTSVISMVGGTPIGLLLALTQTIQSSVLVSIWNDVSKASGNAWTNVPEHAANWTSVPKAT